MIVKVEMVEQEIRQAVAEYIARKYGVVLEPADLHIEVKSKQNFKSEWEQAAIRLYASARPSE